MTTAMSSSLRDYFAHHPFVTLTDTTCAIAVALLVTVLIEREILRMSKPESARRNVVTFAIVVIPTSIVFATVILSRFIRLS